MESHLTRGAWIEITDRQPSKSLKYRRTSHEVRGLKLIHRGQGYSSGIRRTSHEVRGLK